MSPKFYRRDSFQPDAVKATEFSAFQNARTDFQGDLIVLLERDVDDARKLPFQLVQKKRPVILEPLVETLLNPF